MSSRGYQEPPIDKASSRAIVETLCGESNRTVQQGDHIVHRSRICGEGVARHFGLLAHMEAIGVNKEKVNAYRVSLANITIGMSPEIPPYGMRGEIKEVITQQQLPKKETVTNTRSGLIKRPEPQQHQEQIQE